MCISLCHLCVHLYFLSPSRSSLSLNYLANYLCPTILFSYLVLVSPRFSIFSNPSLPHSLSLSLSLSLCVCLSLFLFLSIFQAPIHPHIHTYNTCVSTHIHVNTLTVAHVHVNTLTVAHIHVNTLTSTHTRKYPH